jgi:transcription elongation factor GreA
MERAPITRDGFQRLRDELERMKREDRPKIIKEIQTARAHGDISENAEYHAAREKQGLIEAKIRDIETKLASSEIVETPKGPKSRVAFGCVVKIEEVDSGEVSEYRIVGPYEADIHQGLVSVTSPLARGMIGKGPDDEFVVVAPGNRKEYVILEVGDE